MNLLLWASTAFGSVHAPGTWMVADTQNFSVVNLDDEQIFERRAPEKGIAFARPETRMSVEAGGNSSMGNVGTSVLYSRFYGHTGGAGIGSLSKGVPSMVSRLSTRMAMAPSTTLSGLRALSGPANTLKWTAATTGSLDA